MSKPNPLKGASEEWEEQFKKMLGFGGKNDSGK